MATNLKGVHTVQTYLKLDYHMYLLCFIITKYVTDSYKERQLGEGSDTG